MDHRSRARRNAPSRKPTCSTVGAWEDRTTGTPIKKVLPMLNSDNRQVLSPTVLGTIMLLLLVARCCFHFKILSLNFAV